MQKKKTYKLADKKVQSSQISLKTQAVLKVEDFSTLNIGKLECQFKYNFNDYLRFMLVKIIPFKNVKINLSKQVISGSKKDCQDCLGNVEKQLRQYSMKLLTPQMEVDPEQIQVHIDGHYKSKFYKLKTILLTLQKMKKQYNGMSQEVGIMKEYLQQKKHLIFVHMLKKYEQECLGQIHEIIMQNFNNSDQEGSEIVICSDQQQQVTQSFYSNNQKNSQPIKIKQIEDVLNNEDQNQSGFDSKLFDQSISEEDSISQVNYNSKKKVQQQKPKKKKRYKEATVIQQKIKPKIEVLEKSVQKPYQKRRGNRHEERKLICKYQYSGQDFDMGNFREWLKHNRQIKQEDIDMEEQVDPYSGNGVLSCVITLTALSDIRGAQKKEQLQIYLKYRKVIIVYLKNENYKEQIYEQFQQEEQALTIRVVKGFKSPKADNNNLWSYICKGNISQRRTKKNTEYFEAFQLVGLKNKVEQTRNLILNKLANEPQEDEVLQKYLEFPEISVYLRDNQKLKKYIQKYLTGEFEQFLNNVALIDQITFSSSGISGVKIKFRLPYQKVTIFKQIYEGMKKRIVKQIMVKDYHSPVKIQHQLEKKFKQKYVIVDFENDKKIMKIAGIQKDILKQEKQIQNELKSLNEQTQTNITFEGKSVKRSIQSFVKELIDIQFNDTKSSIYQQDEGFILKLSGPKCSVEQFEGLVQERLSFLDQHQDMYSSIVLEKQNQFLEKDKNIIQDIFDKQGVEIGFSQEKIEAKLIVESNEKKIQRKTIIVRKSQLLDCIPFGSVIAFQQKSEVDNFEDNFLQDFKILVRKTIITGVYECKIKNLDYNIFLHQKKKTEEVLKQAFERSKKSKHITLIMPKNNKAHFMGILLNFTSTEYSKEERNILIIQRNEKQDIQKIIEIKENNSSNKNIKKDKVYNLYYVTDGQNKFYYAKSGNKKIQQAIQRNQANVYLWNEDLDITHKSHVYEPKTGTIIHQQSGKSTKIKMYPGKIEFQLSGITFKMPDSECEKITKSKNAVQISVGVYEINIKKMKQCNLFSNYERSISKDQLKNYNSDIQENVRVFYNQYVDQVEYNYQLGDFKSLINATSEVKKFLQNKIIREKIDLKDFEDKQHVYWSIKDVFTDQTVKNFSLDETSGCLFIDTYDKKDREKAEKMLELLANNNAYYKDVKFPKQWQPQKQDIQSFDVDSTSQQFLDVQKLFTVGKIKKLVRCQNRIIYKKYFDEKKSVSELNGGKVVKTMQLFHGTRATNPEDIYKDKEQSFNINYTSDNNLLGKGIYFAEKSEYSNGYRFQQNGFLSNTYSMFLAEVIVGQSQQCPQHNGGYKDTQFKDKDKKIRYQSMTDFLHGSNVFVVYKTRRAYPLYLIKY